MVTWISSRVIYTFQLVLDGCLISLLRGASAQHQLELKHMAKSSRMTFRPNSLQSQKIPKKMRQEAFLDDPLYFIVDQDTLMVTLLICSLVMCAVQCYHLKLKQRSQTPRMIQCLLDAYVFIWMENPLDGIRQDMYLMGFILAKLYFSLLTIRNLLQYNDSIFSNLQPVTLELKTSIIRKAWTSLTQRLKIQPKENLQDKPARPKPTIIRKPKKKHQQLNLPQVSRIDQSSQLKDEDFSQDSTQMNSRPSEIIVSNRHLNTPRRKSLSIDNHEISKQTMELDQEMNMEIVLEEGCVINVKCTTESFQRIISQLQKFNNWTDQLTNHIKLQFLHQIWQQQRSINWSWTQMQKLAAEMQR